MVTVERRDQLIWMQCSGFLISPRHVLTADFCTRGSLNGGDGQLRDIRLSGRALTSLTPIFPTAVRISEGLAVITLPDRVMGTRPLILSDREPMVREPLMLVYSDPGGEFVASLDAECAVAHVTAAQITYRCDAAPGSAGGALLSAETGAVIAGHTFSGKENRGGIRVDGLAPLGEIP
jgi:V8-like Glu-specific endopeptidase